MTNSHSVSNPQSKGWKKPLLITAFILPKVVGLAVVAKYPVVKVVAVKATKVVFFTSIGVIESLVEKA